jgi:multiple sugar transport system substrate-binding protein
MDRRRFVMRGRTTLFAALAVGALLAGSCTAQGSNTNTPKSINPSGSHAPVNLTVWSFFTGQELKEFNSSIATFEDQYPWIHVTSVPGKQDTDILNAIHSGTAPDVALDGVPDDAVQYCSSNAYLDLKPYIQADHIDLNSAIPAAALNYTAYAEPSSQCMLPMMTDAYGLYYNAALFRKAGISSPPKTYSELFADAKKLTQFNPDGSIKVAGFLPLATGDYELANYVNGAASGAEWYDPNGKSQLASDPRFAQQLQFLKSMADWFGYDKLNKFFSSNGGENTEWSASNLFEHSKIAMVIDGEWRVGFIQNDKSNVPYATAPFPVADNAPQLYGAGQIGGTTIGIPRDTQHPNEAWLLVKHLALTAATQKLLAEKLRNVPTVKGSLDGTQLAQDPQWGLFLKIFANTNSKYKQITKLGSGDVSLYDAFVDKYLAGKVPDVKAGLQQVATQIDNQLKLGA